jgi:hypothetical protein
MQSINLENITRLPKDIQFLMESYLSQYEIFYITGQWNKIPAYSICTIAAQNGCLYSGEYHKYN